MKSRAKITNSKTGKTEKSTQLFRMTADEVCNIDELGVGDIGAITGVEGIRSGDTFLNEGDPERIILSGVTNPPPVFFCSIEAEYSRDQSKLFEILNNLSYEDPSISVSENSETGQLQISGMGELHLEILRDRIELDYGLKSTLGNMRVAYRESVNNITRHSFTLDTSKGGKSQFAEITLEIEGIYPEEPAEEVAEDSVLENLSEKTSEDTSTNHSESEDFNEILHDYKYLEKVSERVKVDDSKLVKRGRKQEIVGDDFELLRSLDSAPAGILKAIHEGVENSLESGQLLGYPVIHTRVRIVDGRWSSVRSDPQSFKEATLKCLKESFSQSSKRLLEPFMKTEIEVPEDCLGDIISNISGKKGGKIVSITNAKEKFSDEIGKP